MGRSRRNNPLECSGTEAGFELAYDVQPLTTGDPVGQPLVKMAYRGVDLHHIARVGDAQVILAGIIGWKNSAEQKSALEEGCTARCPVTSVMRPVSVTSFSVGL
jgi:hypothetical protein